MDLYRTSQQHTFSPCPSFAVTPTGNVHVHAVTIHTETAVRLGTETPVSLSHTCSPPRPPPRTSSHPFSHQHSCGNAATAAPPELHRRDHRLTPRHGHSHWAAQRAGSPNAIPWPLPLASPARWVAQCPGRRPTAPTPAPTQVAPCAPWRRVHPPIWRSPPRRPPAAATGGHGWPQVATGGHWRPPATAAAGSGASREGRG